VQQSLTPGTTRAVALQVKLLFARGGLDAHAVARRRSPERHGFPSSPGFSRTTGSTAAAVGITEAASLLEVLAAEGDFDALEGAWLRVTTEASAFQSARITFDRELAEISCEP
jgi:hypothetical protein